MNHSSLIKPHRWIARLDKITPYLLQAGLFIFLFAFTAYTRYVVPKPLYSFPPQGLKGGKLEWTMYAVKNGQGYIVPVNPGTFSETNMLQIGDTSAPDRYILPLDEPYPRYLNLTLGFILERNGGLVLGLGNNTSEGFQEKHVYETLVKNRNTSHITLERHSDENCIVLVNDLRQAKGQLFFMLFDATRFVLHDKESFQDQVFGAVK